MVLALALIAMFAPTLAGQAEEKKYDLKSGIVTFDVVMSVAGTELKEKAVVTFDDWGAKEKRDTYEGDTIKETFLCDGKDQIKIIHSEKAAYLVGKCTRGTELRFDWNEISDRDKKAGKAKKLPSMKVAGKTCDAFELKEGENTSRFAGSGKITLYSEVAGGMKTVATAVKLEENAAIPAAALRIPAGYVSKKWP